MNTVKQNRETNRLKSLDVWQTPKRVLPVDEIFHLLLPPVIVTSQYPYLLQAFSAFKSSLPTKYLRAFNDETSSLPNDSMRAFGDETSSLPNDSTRPCSSKSRFYLVYKLYNYSDCKYILYTYMQPSMIASSGFEAKALWGQKCCLAVKQLGTMCEPFKDRGPRNSFLQGTSPCNRSLRLVPLCV